MNSQARIDMVKKKKIVSSSIFSLCVGVCVCVCVSESPPHQSESPPHNPNHPPHQSKSPPPNPNYPLLI